MNGGGEFCARPVKPFGRGRPWLRWTRALCKFNCGKERVLRCAETVLRGTTHDTVRAEIGYERKSIAKTVVEEAGRRDRFGGEAEKYGARRRHAEFSSWREWFHAAAVTLVENEVGFRQP